jgi:hypothetical protein
VVAEEYEADILAVRALAGRINRSFEGDYELLERYPEGPAKRP